METGRSEDKIVLGYISQFEALSQNERKVEGEKGREKERKGREQKEEKEKKSMKLYSCRIEPSIIIIRKASRSEERRVG